MKWYSLQAVELFSESTLLGDLIPLNIYPLLKEQHFDSPAALEIVFQWLHENPVRVFCEKNGIWNNTTDPQ